MASVHLDGAEKIYPNGHVAARGLDIAIADGEFMVLVGPSGCGKSTALRMIAGLETPTAGRVLIGDRDVTALPPQERDIAMVFQSYALYPHMTVRQNLGFGLRMRGAAHEAIARRIDAAAHSLGLEAVLERKPSQLSGGQRQRVALGRAMVRDPQVFLFDEPLSNLDAKLRVETRAELARLHRRLKATIVYVTHDQEEALTLGSRVTVMRDGLVEQVGPPMEVYRRPASIFVGGFVGSPAMNFMAGTVRNDGSWAGPEGLVLPVEAGSSGSAAPTNAPRAVTLGVRPHDVAIVAAGTGDVDARVDVVEPRGSELLVHLKLGADGGGAEVRVVAPPDQPVVVEATMGLRCDRQRLHWFDTASGKRLGLESGR
ncbi:MAG TPA: sn-glycerol-3-phosphate ABC transporter ATP-binding protein UgpC [Gemmatimonadales bacterium]|nr:sn-glycerol-3-phosphate ABC transporter ATP-binding protein UgpC [Gemmatimonadales bacterium]